MTIPAGTLLGPYEIQTLIGAGGMGEVYRARDTRLDRMVAIKVLPPELSARPDLSERFEREARVISSLNHPHICTLHDVGRQDGAEYLVMEYLEGETLAERLKKGPLPVDQVLRYATEIADALDKAHRQGVTHRDLKPGNIMLTKSGSKLLDFGLAKLKPAAPGLEAPGKASQLPTRGAKSESANLTAEGMIVGTLQYMSPEQLEGLEADARSDIFAFGAVLYEMLTGRKAFEGRSQSSVIAAIIHVDPPGISVVQPMTPPALDRIVRICLAKDPNERWQTAHDLALQLQWIHEGGSLAGVAAPVAARRRSRERLMWVLLALALLLIMGLSIPALLYFRLAPPGEVSRFLVDTPLMPNAYQVSVSPDGSKIAFVARSEAGMPRLFVRPMDSVTSQELPGTDNAINPFWSPDGRHIAFGSGTALKKVESTGGPPLIICSMGIAGGTWNEEGVIVFSSGNRLYRVSAAGGNPAALAPDKSSDETAHLWPYFLPDGRHYLYLAWSSQANKRAIYVGTLDSDQKILVATADSMPVFAGGFLVFQREGTLFAQSFDTSRFTLEGEPTRLAENVPYNPDNGRSAYAVSSNGVLVHRSAADVVIRQLSWFDRGGRQLQTVGTPGPFENFDLSPDEKRIVIWRRDPKATGIDLWILEISNGVLSRFTFDPATDLDPVWSPDNQTIAFTSPRNNHPSIFQKVMGSREETPVFESRDGFPWWVDDWSPDGRFLIGNGAGSRNIFALPTTGDRKPIILTESKNPTYDEPHFSPDGGWIAYTSSESGRPEIYIASFPEFKNIRQVSAGGGQQPRWRRDGKELYYLDLDRRLMSIEVRRQDSSIETAAAKPLFQTRVPALADFYEPSSDGSRFLILTTNEDSKPTPITVVLNWTGALK